MIGRVERETIVRDAIVYGKMTAEDFAETVVPGKSVESEATLPF